MRAPLFLRKTGSPGVPLFERRTGNPSAPLV